MDLERFAADVREHYQQGRYGAVVAMTDEALNQVAEGHSPRAESVVLMWRGIGYRSLGRRGRAVSCLTEALRQSRLVGDPVLTARIIAALLAVYAATPDREAVQAFLDEYRELTRKHAGAAFWEPWVTYNQGVCLEWAGDLEEAGRAYASCLDACSVRLGEPSVAELQGIAATNLAGILLEMRRPQEAWQHLEAARRTLPAAKLPMVQNFEARCFVLTGQLNHARMILETTGALPELDEMVRAELSLTWVLLHQAEGQLERAREAAYLAMNYAYKSRPEHGPVRDKAVKILRNLGGTARG